MRIAWFTPLARRSAIARYSAVVLAALGQRAEVRVVAPVDSSDDDLAMPVATHRYTEGGVADVLEGFDVAIFNMGDSPYHFGIWAALAEARAALHPAVVILHDCFYLHLLHDYAVRTGDPGRVRRQLEAVHGRSGADEALALLRSGAPLEALASFPLVEPVRDAADAFIVHSRFCREQAGLKGDDVLELFIPVEYASRAPAARTRSRVADDKLVLLTLGVGNRNKCLHLVLEALARDAELARGVRYVAAGGVEPGYLAELRAFAAAHRLDVDFRGYVDDAELDALLGDADICINLRRPCLEGGSASLVDMLAAGKPLVVFDDGVYAEVPDACAVKLPRDAGADALAAAMVRLANDARARTSMGEAAHAFVHREWTRERYAEHLVERFEAWQDRWAAWPGLRAVARKAGRELDALGLPVRGRLGRLVADQLAAWQR